MIQEPSIIKDYKVRQGSDFKFPRLRWRAGGLPKDLTGYRFVMQVRVAKLKTSTQLLELTSDTNGGITFDPTAGTIDRIITSAQTQELTSPAPCFYDLKAYGPTGDETRLREGKLVLDLQVTTP